mgnify:CR=1 FL=1
MARPATTPAPSGAGNLKPAPQVRKLIEGLRSSPVPVLCVGTDTFATAIEVNTVRPVLTAENKRKIAAAIGDAVRFALESPYPPAEDAAKAVRDAGITIRE